MIGAGRYALQKVRNIYKEGSCFLGMRGRRAQGFLPSNTGEWIIAIVLVVVIIIAIVVANRGVTNLAGQLPADTQSSITACKNSGSEVLRQAYCDQLRPATIGGVQQKVTCPYLVTEYADAAPSVAVDCSRYFGKNADLSNQGKDKCGVAFRNGEVSSDTTINGVLCATLLCADLGGGKASLTTPAGCVAPAKAFTKGFFIPAGSPSDATVCCVTVSP
jgi:hypothetical protein